jgi:hypothetical protein
MLDGMKLNRDELSGAVIVSTNSVLNSMITLNLLLSFGQVRKEMLESIDANISYYGDAIKFAESVIDELTDDARAHVLDNLEQIREVTRDNSEKMTEMYSYD